MTRPNPLLLGAFLVAALTVLAAAGLMKGGLYLGKHEGDVLHLLQMVLREARGAWPHLDFETPIGVLATAPIAIFVRFGAGAGHAFLYAQTLFAVVALPMIWWVAASRFPGALGHVFGLVVLVLILALVHGEADRSVSISMHYNRWAWALAFVAIAAAVLPPAEGARVGPVDGVVIGAAFAAMALIKVTYVVAFLPPVAVALAGRRAGQAGLAALATGAGVALVVTLLAGPQFWPAYLGDLATVAASEVRPRAGLPYGTVIGAPAYMGGTVALLVGVILLRQTDRKFEGLLLLLLAPGFFYVTYQNFRNDPQWLALLGLMLLALRPTREHHGAAAVEPRQGLLIAATAAFAFATPSLVNLAYSPFRHLAVDGSDYVALLPQSAGHDDLFTPRIRAYRVDAQVAMDHDGAPFAAYEDPALRASLVDFAGERWPDCEIQLGTIAFFEALSGDLVASGLVAGKTLFAADVLSSYWLYGAGEPLPGAAPWYYGGLPGWGAADYLLVPLCPLSTKVRKLILDAVTAEGTPLTEVRRTETYVLYAR